MSYSPRRDKDVLLAIDTLLNDENLSDGHRQELQRIRTDIERAFRARDRVLVVSLAQRLSDLITWIIDHLPP